MVSYEVSEFQRDRSWNAVGIQMNYWQSMEKGLYRRSGSIRSPYTDTKKEDIRRHLHSFTTPLCFSNSFPFLQQPRKWYLPTSPNPTTHRPPRWGYCGCSYFISAATLIRISAIGVGAARLGECEAWNGWTCFFFQINIIWYWYVILLMFVSISFLYFGCTQLCFGKHLSLSFCCI